MTSTHLPVLSSTDTTTDARKIAAVSRTIESVLVQHNQTLEQAILERDLYLRISLLGTCNLSCTFCHNEGAPTSGILGVPEVLEFVREAAKVGFTRVQFTGGEPLLHPQVADFVRGTREIVSDVGVTTNGTRLQVLPALISAGLSRLHISLQVPVLQEAGGSDGWGIPEWLTPSLELLSMTNVNVRLNLPIPADGLKEAAAFIRLPGLSSCNLKVFSILPEGQAVDSPYPLDDLKRMVDAENDRRTAENVSTRVLLRGYAAASGMRCRTCDAHARCTEQSRSLRIGADRVLRPCLATRKWDTEISEHESLVSQIRTAALLAIDFRSFGDRSIES